MKTYGTIGIGVLANCAGRMNEMQRLARIIHECRCEAAETEARRGFSHVRATQADLRSVEETKREKPRRARGSAAVVGVHEYPG
jgi:hypothetical protein